MVTKPPPSEVTPAIAGSDELYPLPTASSISKVAQNTYTISATERLGKVFITGASTVPVGKWDFVALYDVPPGENPNADYLSYFYLTTKGWLLTDSAWGAGYYVAYGSWDYRSSRYVKVAEAGPT